MQKVTLAIGILEILLGLVIVIASMTIPVGRGAETSAAAFTIFLSGIVVTIGGIILLAAKR